MKNKYFFIASIIISLLFVLPKESNAQFFKKLGDKAKAKIEGEADKRSEKMVNKKIDEGYDKAEDQIEGTGKKKDKSEKEAKKEKPKNTVNQNQQADKAAKQPNVVWSKFDFVPGDQVIFEDGPSTDEENGEFPSRWDLKEGNAEIAEIDGVNAIVFPHGGVIVPYLKNPKEDYLPDVFTIEFDAYFDKDNKHRFWIAFYDKKNQSRNSNAHRITFYPNSIGFNNSTGQYPKELPLSGWRHFSVAFTKGKLKVYLNDTRLINIPHAELKPTGITFENDGYSADKTFQYMKNFRVAKGGVKYYDRVLSDGKIVVNGIKFDINKATLRPESMGPINKIYKLMVKNPDIKFSVEGHTDSDGDDATNLTLSKARGKSVMDKLISMGIDKSRLKSNGFGESKPIDTNGTPEGKANNRRVEFVKF